MAQLVDSPEAQRMRVAGANFQQTMDNQSKVLDEIRKKAEALPDGEVVGGLLSYPVADGSALYLVVKEKPLQVSHLPFADAYGVHPAMIRGLNLADVRTQIAQNKRFAAMFASKRTTNAV